MVLSFISGAHSSAVTAAVKYIYWPSGATSRGPEGPGVDTVARADLNGANINRDFIHAEGTPPGGDGGLAVDAKHIYWVDDEGEAIGRADINGSHIDHSFIHRAPSRGEFHALLVHGGNVYWSTFNSPEIGRARIDGTHITRSFLNVGHVIPGDDILGLAADGNHLYWTYLNGAASGAPT